MSTAEKPLTANQRAALKALAVESGLTPWEISEDAAIPVSSARTALMALERRELVFTRGRVYELTGSGRALAEAAQ